jgi:hypothetical protein
LRERAARHHLHRDLDACAAAGARERAEDAHDVRALTTRHRVERRELAGEEARLGAALGANALERHEASRGAVQREVD